VTSHTGDWYPGDKQRSAAGLLALLLSGHHIDLERIKQAIQPHVTTKATYFVDRARAETLFQFGEQDAAVAIIAPYAYGEKPEEVEVPMGSGDASP
jgi:hypothetical protein